MLTCVRCGCRDAVGNWKLVGYGVGTLHILLRLFIYWNVKFASSVQFQRVGRHEDATDVLVLPTEFSGLPEIVSLLHRTLVSTRSSWSSFLRPSSTMMRPMHPIVHLGTMRCGRRTPCDGRPLSTWHRRSAQIVREHRTYLQDNEKEVGFEFRKQRFCWDEASSVFKTLQFPDHVSYSVLLLRPAWSTETETPSFVVHAGSIRNRMRVGAQQWHLSFAIGVDLTTASMRMALQETFDAYRKASGLGSQGKVATALQRWGPNRFDVPLPPFGSLLKVRLDAGRA